MAVVKEIDKVEWDKWVEGRPPIVQDLCRRFPPDRLYLYKPTNHRVTLYSYSEDGTMTIVVLGDYNAVIFPRQVFGIKPEDLVECDLPAKNEPCGAMLTSDEDIEAFVELHRQKIKEG